MGPGPRQLREGCPASPPGSALKFQLLTRPADPNLGGKPNSQKRCCAFRERMGLLNPKPSPQGSPGAGGVWGSEDAVPGL